MQVAEHLSNLDGSSSSSRSYSSSSIESGSEEGISEDESVDKIFISARTEGYISRTRQDDCSSSLTTPNTEKSSPRATTQSLMLIAEHASQLHEIFTCDPNDTEFSTVSEVTLANAVKRKRSKSFDDFC